MPSFLSGDDFFHSELTHLEPKVKPTVGFFNLLYIFNASRFSHKSLFQYVGFNNNFFAYTIGIKFEITYLG